MLPLSAGRGGRLTKSLRGRARAAAACALSCAAAACAAAPSARPLPAAPAQAEAVVSDRLFFGRAIPGGGMVSDSAWSAFLAEVITPRFPAGLTLWRAEGQWLDPRGDTVREPVMVVEVLHPPGAPADSVFARIADEYRRRFRQDAVLRSTSAGTMLLYPAPRP